MTIAQIPFPNMMRPSAKRAARVGEEIIVDLFAGGGGASTGIEHALGRDVDDAINHDAEAIEMHTRNHPATRHHQASVWEVDPKTVARGRKIGLLWLSPDCTDFSRAKGGQPIRDRRIRSLAWVGPKWAREVRPRVIMLENVREFQEWGPLIHQPATVAAEPANEAVATRTRHVIPDVYLWQIGKKIQAKKGRMKREKPTTVMGPKSDAKAGPWLQFWKSLGYKAKPLMIRDPKRIGETFRRFIRQLQAQGYEVEWKVLNASGYNTPTHRKRFFLIARCDGNPITWPDPTNGPGLLDFRTAAECIEWSIKCPSIFGRKKPLAANTQRRIAMGLKRYVFDAVSPFIVQVNHGGTEFRGQSINEPMPTLTQKHGFGIVAPVMTKNTPNEKPCQGVAELLHTITTIHNKFQLAEATLVPFITRCAHGEGRWGHGTHSVESPLPTQTASKDFALTGVTLIPFVAGVGGRAGQSPATPGDGPIGTITAKNDRALVGVSLVEVANSNWSQGTRPVDSPMATITATPKGGSWALAAVYLTKLRGSGGWKAIDAPLDTIVATATTFCITTPILTILRNHADGQRVDQPTPTLTAAGQHIALACPFCVSYYGQGVGQPADVPLRTVTTKDRFGLAVPTLSDDPSTMGRAVDVYHFLMKYKDLIGTPANVTFHHNVDGTGFVTLKVGGGEFLMTDLLLRMLTPRELLRAQFSPELAADYILPKSNAAAVHKIGNSVCPLVVSALVKANLSDLIVKKRRKSA